MQDALNKLAEFSAERKNPEWTSQEYKSAFLNAALDCIVTMDQAGVVTEWNKAAEKVFEYTQAFAVGKKLADLIIPERYREKHSQGLARYLATGEHIILDKRVELPARRASGEEFPVELTVTHFKFGTESLFTGFMRDVSEQKKLERTKAAFLENVSHEFRTPIHLILEPAADALRDNESPLSFHQRERLKLIHSNALRLLKLANSVLDFSKSERGRLQGHYEPVDLTVFTAELVEAFRATTTKAGLTLQVILMPLGEPAWVDKEMWEKMVFNLLSNAIKYTATGGITVTLGAQDGKVIFRVADTGTGIPEAEQENIFKRFYQVDNIHGRSLRGLGIGLALTQELIKLHGGSIQVESQVDKGSTFTLSFPLGRAHLPPQQVSETALPPSALLSMGSAFVGEAMRWLPEEISKEKKDKPSDQKRVHKASQPSTLAQVSSRMKPVEAKILLVEDNAEMRGYLSRLLAEHWEVKLAENGKIALAAILKEKPDLILSNAMMPEMTGLQLIETLRQDSNTADTPIILISDHSDEEFRADSLEQGADDYLVKPFSARELVIRVKTQLELRQMRSELEKKVEQQALELQLFSAVSPIGIFHCNAAGGISYVNPRACEIMGQTADYMKGLGWLRTLHPEDKKRITELWCKAAGKKAERFTAKFRCLRPDGTTVWITIEATPEKDDAGQIKGYINALTDVTEWKALEKSRFDAVQHAEEQYRQRAQDAEAYRKRQEQFIDTMCHELRNPLNGIYGNVNLLEINLAAFEKFITTESLKLDESVQQEIVKYIAQTKQSVRAIDTCARHQKIIADDVLNLSKLEAGKVELNLVDFDPKKVIQDVIDMLDAEVIRKKIQLYVQLLHTELRVNGDRYRLAQVLLNLLSNAIKFTPEKGKIWVSMSQEEAEENYTLLKFSVKDTGIGMSDTEKAKAFDRFAQATRATYSEYGGSGLGLAISKNLVELMGGKIEVESKVESGSKFTFIVKCKIVPVLLTKSPVSLLFKPSLPAATTPKTVRRILIVEDNLINQAILRRNLEEAGHHCDIANNGKEACEATEKSTYDIILMDVQMPVMDGFEATKLIRQREAVEKRIPVPIIGLSGNAREEHIEAAKQAGMNDYLTKPYERSILLEKIAFHTFSMGEGAQVEPIHCPFSSSLRI